VPVMVMTVPPAVVPLLVQGGKLLQAADTYRNLSAISEPETALLMTNVK